MLTTHPQKGPKIIFDWGVSDHYGWGIYGYNILLNASEKFAVYPMEPISLLHPIDPLTALKIRQSLPRGEIVPDPSDVLLSALGNVNKKRDGVKCRNIGVIFFENNPMPEHEIEVLTKFEYIIAGSTWNCEKLKSWGVECHKVIQGVDIDTFRPLKKRKFRNRFVVFSGGKLEHRKAQDLALKAFSIFAARHDDAVMVVAWRSPWEKQLSGSINVSGVCNPYIEMGEVDTSIYKWARENGVDDSQFICLPATANRLMAEVFREVDVGLFPNRCEGGTNLVAMEAMASGITCIISANTGHLDLISETKNIPLLAQSKILRTQCEDWGESSIEEIVENLERCYSGHLLSSDDVRSSIVKYSWVAAIDNLLATLLVTTD